VIPSIKWTNPSTNATPDMPNNGRYPSSIDVDALQDQPLPVLPPKQCCGIQITFLAGASPHSLYPYGIDDGLGDLWDYDVRGGIIIICSKWCSNTSHQLSGPRHCKHCEMLTENANLQGVI
jgi:hypothetical protein